VFVHCALIVSYIDTSRAYLVGTSIIHPICHIYHQFDTCEELRMSNNISSDGSPTPRKNNNRFNVHEDLRLDTSAETLSTVVGAETFRAIYGDSPPRMQSYHPLASYTQGVKRPGSISQEGLLPLTTSKLVNQGRPATRSLSLKVSPTI
jgi:hypothetical protein